MNLIIIGCLIIAIGMIILGITLDQKIHRIEDYLSVHSDCIKTLQDSEKLLIGLATSKKESPNGR